MAGERIQLGVKARESAGSGESRRLRSAGMIPGVLYGSGKKAHPFVVEERELRRTLLLDEIRTEIRARATKEPGQN